MKSPFLSAPEMEQIVSLHWVCFDTGDTSFGGERPLPHYVQEVEQDVDDFVRFELRSIDAQLYLSCYEVWEKGFDPFQAYARECLEDQPKLYEYQGKDYYVRACDIPVNEWTNDSLESMLRLVIDKLWEKNAFLRILLNEDISDLHKECAGSARHLQQAYEDAQVRYKPSRRFFSSEEF